MIVALPGLFSYPFFVIVALPGLFSYLFVNCCCWWWWWWWCAKSRILHKYVSLYLRLYSVENKIYGTVLLCLNIYLYTKQKVKEKSRECHNHKPQPFPDPKRKRKPTNLNKHKPNKRTKSTTISCLFPKRGNRNTKRTEKHKNKMTHGKSYNKSPRRISLSESSRKHAYIILIPLNPTII